jgi:hypothetical protein
VTRAGSNREVCVFLGPSVPLAAARAILDATYLPPVAMGDVYRVVRDRAPAVIAIIDGFFEQVPAVWHKELLFALERGVRVLGASSMGALRAAEMADLGVEGVGEIFAAYRTGALTDDDEVAVVHATADDGYRPLSEAMVNLRAGLARARERGAITRPTHDALVAAGKATFYADRSWPRLYRDGRERGLDPGELAALEAVVRAERPNLKRADGEALLAQIAAERAAGLAPARPIAPFEKTSFWLELETSVGRRCADVPGPGGLTEERVRDHVRVTHPALDDVRRGALLYHLVAAEAARLGLAPAPDRLQAATDRFRLARGLAGSAATQQWLERNALDRRGLAGLVGLELAIEELLVRFAPQIDERMADELRRRGEYAAAIDGAAAKTRFLAEAGLANPTGEDVGDAERVLRWYQEEVRAVGAPLDEHARGLGFGSLRGFLVELFGQYLYARSIHDQAR